MEKGKINFGFTLIELLIVIAIIGILTTIAIPFYMNHQIKAKLTEVTNAMAVLKTSVMAYYRDTNSWPTCPSNLEVKNTLGVGLGSVDRIGEVSIINGLITVEIQNIHPTVNGKRLKLIPEENGDGSISWTWGWSPDFPVHLRPKGN